MGTTSGGATWGATNLGGDALFNTVAYANSSQGYTIDLTGLDAGKSYQLQFLFADPRGGSYPYTGTASVSDNLTPTPNTASATVSYGKTAVGDEFAMLTAVVSGSTSFKFTSPNQGTGGPVLSGLVVHSFAPLAGQPTSTNDSRTLTEDTQAMLTTDDFGSYSDPNSQPLAAVKITTLPSTGSLEYDTTGAGAWAAVTANQEISAANLTAGRLRFSPLPDGNGSPYATIGFRVGNGTVFSFPYTLTLNVTPINDYAPTAANRTVGVAQGATRTQSAVDFGFADADGNDTLQKIQVTQLPTAGNLTLNAVSVTLDQEIPVADINAGLLKFTAAPNASGLAYATFKFKVSDGTFYSVAAYTMTIDIIPVFVAQSASHISFANNGTLVGAAVFGNPGTYDGIPFSLWDTPFATPTLSLGSGVSVTIGITGGTSAGSVTGGAFGTDQQYQFGAYLNSTPRGMTFTFTGLDSSRKYQFQFGYGDTRTLYNYNEDVTVALDSSPPAPVRLAFGSAAAGDEYALLTATATNTTTLVLSLPQTVGGFHGPMQAGFSVHMLDGTTAYDTWANGTFANGNLSDKTPSGNPDSDGLTNQQEFAFGLDPTTGASSNPISQQLNKGTRTFKYTRTKASGLTYNYQYSTTLSAPWVSFMSATTPPPASLSATVEEVTVEVPAALITANSNTLFVRVKAE